MKLAEEMGWATIANGRLLTAAEQAGFNVLLTGDQSLRYEQSMIGRSIAVVAMSDNHWNIVKDHIAAIVNAIQEVQPGEMLPVHCGKFVARKFRRPTT